MPEGDTLHRTAATLSKALGGQALVSVRSSVPAVDGAGLVGHKVESVTALGKNLVIRFDDGRMLHTHLRMNGSWHLYRPRERWRRPSHEARVVLDVGDIVAVCFSAPTVRIVRAPEPRQDIRLAELGPDLVADSFDASEALRRLKELGGVALGEAIVDQRAIAGIGNIYKSESLFLCRVDPFAPVSSYDDATLAAVIAQARTLMRANVVTTGRPRMTRRADGGRYWVYRRAGKPCFRCRAAIEMMRQGELRRSTYFCPVCQAHSTR